MKIPLTAQGKAKVEQEPEVEVTLHAKIRVPMSFLTGREPTDEERPTTDEELWDVMQEDHVYSTDPVENALSILSDCGMFDKEALKELDITIVSEQ